MQKDLILSKGKYSYEQPEELLSLRQYLFVRDGRKKQLLLRFKNDRQESCEKFSFLLVMLDAKGKVLGEEMLEYGGAPISANTTFAFDKKIVVAERCTDFRVHLVRASFGNYTYQVSAEDVAVSYVKKTNSATRRTQRQARHLSVQKPQIPWFYLIVALLLISLVFLAALYQVDEFTENETEFTLYGVQYEFVDPTGGSDEVIITGYAGYYRNILLPSEIEGHPVVGIEEGAFAGNQILKRVRIEGLEVSKNAFMDCRNLEEVQLSDVTVIGEGAFANCKSLLAIESDTLTVIEAEAFLHCEGLERLSISNDDEAHLLYIDSTAFEGCRGLREISIDTYLHYGEKQAIFEDSTAIESLHLKNFYYTMENNPIPEDYVNKIAALFGREAAPTALGELATVSIDYIDAITESFAEGLWRLESFSINASEVSEVQRSAFLDCKSLREFSLTVPLTFVNSYAFKNTALTQIDLSHVSYIGGEAFMGCTALEKVTMREDSLLEGIGYAAFEGCTALGSFVFPEKLQRLSNNYVFRGCTSLTDVIFAENSKIKSLPTGLFYGCESLVYINLPDGIRTIGEQAFFGCLAMESFTYPTSLREIGAEAFGATGLRSFVLPDESVSLGKALLVYCTSLERLELPYLPYGESASALFGVRTFDSPEQAMARVSPALTTVVWNNTTSVLPDYMFYGFTGLRELRLAKPITAVGQYGFAGCTALSDFDFTPVTDIGAFAFYQTGLVSVQLPDTVSLLEASVFENCTALAEVILPNTLTAIGNAAFAGCAALSEIALPDTLTVMGDAAFCGCTSLARVALPSLITVLPERSFDGCTSLKEVLLPTGLSKIGMHALRGTGVASLEVPVTVISIGEGAFADCVDLAEITLPFIGDGQGTYTHLGYVFGVENSALSMPQRVTVSGSVGIVDDAFADCAFLEEVHLLQISSIGREAFRDCGRLLYVSLPATLRRIDATAFDNCYRLFEICNQSSLTVPCEYTLSFITNEANRAAERYVGDYRFACYNGIFTLIDYPADETVHVLPVSTGFSYRIPAYLFYGDEGVTEVILPAAVKEIGEYAFAACPSLVTVRVADSNTQLVGIAPYTFYGCTALERVTLSRRIERIDAYAFLDCSSLTVLTLPSYLKEIGEGAFFNCSALYDIYYSPLGSSLQLQLGSRENGGVARYAVAIHASASEGLSTTVSVGDMTFRQYGGSWLLLAYHGTDKSLTLDTFTYNGKAVTNIRINPYVFDGTSLETVVLGAAVTQVGEGAFANCTELRFVTVQSLQMKELEAGTFAGCSHLRRVTLPDSIKVIGSSAFAGCTLLESVNLPSSLTEIGSSAFENCGKLLSVKLPRELRSIGIFAFRGCEQLYEVYDLTPHITVLKGSADNGYVGKYAVAVLTSASAVGLPRYEKDGVSFIELDGRWCIYTAEYGKHRSLLSIPDYGSDVRILPRAFADIAVSALVLPASVTDIPANAFDAMRIDTLYYGGSNLQWIAVSNAQHFDEIFYYAQCVHGHGAWTYTADGTVTTEPCVLLPGRVHTPAGCESEGELRYDCACGCGYFESAAIPPVGHSFDESHSCTVCGKDADTLQ